VVLFEFLLLFSRKNGLSQIVQLLALPHQKLNRQLIRVIDSDGEFLMIEAAESLPRWADPDTCINRVYLHCGQVHIISLADRPSGITPLPSGTPSLMDAVHIVRSMPHLTQAPASIQQPILQRIEKCASEIGSSLHRCNVHVPAAVAVLLNNYPALVAPAVHALCQRDASQLQVTRAMRYFPPETRVWTSVKFTKCLYAMTVQHSFQPDRRTGWTLAPVGDAQRLGSELGLKLAVGFELLANVESVQQQKNGEPQAIEADPRWNRFLTTLKDKGFFQDFLEGSQDHCALKEKARDFFLSSVDVSDAPLKEPVILRLLESLTVDMEKLKRAESRLPPNDDDSWLNVDPTTLEEILANKFGEMRMENASEIVPQLDSFLNKNSDFEGLNAFSTSGKDRKTSRKMSQLLNASGRKVSTMSNVSNGSDVSQISNKIGFDADSFNVTMQGILDFVLPEDDWDLESNSSGSSTYSDEGEDRTFAQDADFDNEYTEAMHKELLTTNVPHTSLDANRKESVLSEASDTFSDVESFQPVKIDSSALESLLTSYTLQHGHPGPASTLLNHLNLPRRSQLPATEEDNESN